MSDKPTLEQIENGHNELARAYLSGLLELMALEGSLEEVNFMKKTVETPEGGTYLLQFQHVSGPKINLKDLPKE